MSRIKELRKLTVVLKKKGGITLKEIDINTLMKIDEDKLVEERIALPELYSTFSVLSAIAKGKVLDAKMTVETLMAQSIKDAKATEEFKGVKEKWKLEAGIISSQAYTEAYHSYISAQKQYEIISSIVKSLEIKKDMIMSLSADKRKEMETY